MNKFMALFLMVLLLAGSALAGDEYAPKFSGYMFGDYYYIAGNHNPDFEKMNGFWLRRAYFTFDKGLNEAFAVRLRLEMGNPDGLTKSADKAVPFVKDAYLSYKLNGHKFYFGISSSPTWNLIEHWWGYRSVEKTPLDLQKFGSSRDFGIAVKGKLGSSGKVTYHAMLGNGHSNKSEEDKGKKMMLAVAFHPTKAIVLEVYGDWDDNEGKTDWITLQGFLGYKSEKFRCGLQYAHQTRKVEAGEDMKLKLGSVFAAGKLGKKVNFFGRVDRLFDPNPKGAGISYIPFDPTAKATFFVAGLDFTPAKNIHFMPNLEMVVYDEPDGGEKPDSDIIPRLTTYFKF